MDGGRHDEVASGRDAVSAAAGEVPTRSLTSRQILDTTVEFFAEKGYRGTSLDEVADRLGVTRQALYYYFPRKHDLLVAICEELQTDLLSAVEAASRASTDPVERLRAMVRAYVLGIASRPTYSAVVVRDFNFLPPQQGRQARDRRREITDRFLEAMEEAVDAGLAKPVPPHVSVSLILGAGNWVYRWFRPTAGMSPADLAGLAADMLLDGVLAPRASHTAQG
jgi:TetR/AcrR family transcriptional regulator, cholesterol catabolism regulator